MFTLIRTTSTPASPIRIQVAQPEGNEAGLTLGGSFYFLPSTPETTASGEDRACMSEFAAREILRDPVYGPHFRCEPPLPAAAPATPAVDPKKRRGDAAEPGV